MQSSFAIGLVLLLLSVAAHCAERESISLGINSLGGQMRYLFAPAWAAEARYTTGSAAQVRAHTFGLRGYRLFKTGKIIKPYLGAEVAYATASQRSTGYQARGQAVGCIGGIEYRMSKRLSIGLDIGPYVLMLRSGNTGRSDTSLNFVGNCQVNIYVF